MAVNPSYKPTKGANMHTAPTNQQNVDTPYVVKTHNTFDMSYYNYQTPLYGRYTPHFITPVVAGDVVPLTHGMELRGPTLKSPLMSDLYANKDYAFIPWQAILPQNWEKIYRNPSQGSDVPEDANTCLKDFCGTYVQPVIVAFFQALQDIDAPTTFQTFTSLFLRALVLEQYMSTGSLLALLGYHISPARTAGTPSFDTFLDAFYTAILPNGFTFTIKLPNEEESRSFIVGSDEYVYGPAYVTRVAALELLRDYYPYLTSITVTDRLYTHWAEYKSSVVEYGYIVVGSEQNTSDIDGNLNYGALIAYNITCAQFFTNPKVDWVYDADIYRQSFKSLLGLNIVSAIKQTYYFPYNGMDIPYDYFSAKYVNLLLKFLASEYTVSNEILMGSNGRNSYAAFQYIFGLKNSLRYGDYFTGARTRPYGVGDLSIVVNGGFVNAVDVTRELARQRYLNVVQKIGNSYEAYNEVMSGEQVPPDYHYPQFISHAPIKIKGFEVANTTSIDQGNQVTRLDTTESQFEFDAKISIDGFVIGITWFYMPRAYSKTRRRWFMHSDRFDMFQVMLQNIGDQAVFGTELDAVNAESIVGYQGRNEEYKQTYSEASGDFADRLSSWAYVADASNEWNNIVTQHAYISPFFIRSVPYEFDRFFNVPSGLSLGHYYHFIVAHMNQCPINRPMQKSPQIL